jgi:adenylylsulfate kinase
MVPRETKEKLLNQKGVVIWFTGTYGDGFGCQCDLVYCVCQRKQNVGKASTPRRQVDEDLICLDQSMSTGLSGSGKSTVACTLEHALAARGKVTVLLDGDNVRHGLNSNLGFKAEDREENIRRIGEVSKLFAESGIITLTSFISPYRADRAKVRERMAKGDFLEVYMRIPIEICEERDPKGLYKAARAGKIKNFTGIDDPYEEPENPEITLDAKDKEGNMASAEDMAAEIIRYLEENTYLQGP